MLLGTKDAFCSGTVLRIDMKHDIVELPVIEGLVASVLIVRSFSSY